MSLVPQGPPGPQGPEGPPGPPGALAPLSTVLAQGNSAGSYTINMNSNKIVNLATPTNPTDAVTKAYVDNLPGGVPTLGQVMTVGNTASASLNMGTYSINAQTINNAGGAVTLQNALQIYSSGAIDYTGANVNLTSQDQFNIDTTNTTQITSGGALNLLTSGADDILINTYGAGDINLQSDSGQVGIITNVGSVVSSPTDTGVVASSAILDVRSSTKGFAPPRMTSTQRQSITSPVEGLIVYDTTIKAPFVYANGVWCCIDLLSVARKLLYNIDGSNTYGAVGLSSVETNSITNASSWTSTNCASLGSALSYDSGTNTLTLTNQLSNALSSVVVGGGGAVEQLIASFTFNGNLITSSTQLGPAMYANGNYTITKIRTSTRLAPSANNVIVDVKKNDTSIFTSDATRPTLAIGSTTSIKTPDTTTLTNTDKLNVELTQSDKWVWASTTSGASGGSIITNITNIAYGAGLFVVSSTTVNGVYYTSPDGITWTSRTITITPAWGSTVGTTKIIYTGAVFIAISNSATSTIIARSTDGINWTRSALGGTFSTVLIDVVGNGNEIVAVGSSNLIFVSTDGGLNFLSTSVSGSWYSGFTYVNGGIRYWLLGGNSQISYATSLVSGGSWTNVVLSGAPSGVGFIGNFGVNNNVIVCGAITNTNGYTYTANPTNLNSWTARPVPIGGYVFGRSGVRGYGFVTDSKGNIFASTQLGLLRSSNGIDWSPVNLPSDSTGSVVTGHGVFIASNDTIICPGGALTASYDNGNTFTTIPNMCGGNDLYFVEGGGRYVVVLSGKSMSATAIQPAQNLTVQVYGVPV